MIAGLVLYECGICNCYHPWWFDGDCRDDRYRTFPDEYAKAMGCDEMDIEVRTMDERVAADQKVD